MTYSVVSEVWWIQSCRFLLLCDVERSMRRVRYDRFVFFEGAGIAGLLCLHSHAGLPEPSGVADGMGLHLRLSGASRLYSLYSQSSVEGSSSDFHGELQNRCHVRKKNAWSQHAPVGPRSQCSAGRLWKWPRHTNVRFIRLT